MGRIARTALEKFNEQIKKEYQADFVIANAENLSQGKGVSERTLDQMLACGIDFFTSGNHIFDKSSAIPIFEQDKYPIVRPANYPPQAPGSGYKIIEIGVRKICVINLMGRVFIRENFDCPFRAMDQILEQIKNENLSAIIVDIHAEATSEKQGLMHYLDSKVSAVIGTHTHVQTADEQISENGTAYISDAGMVGAKNAILGVEAKGAIKNFLTQIPEPQAIPDTGTCILNGVFLEIDCNTKKAIQFSRINKEVGI